MTSYHRFLLLSFFSLFCVFGSSLRLAAQTTDVYYDTKGVETPITIEPSRIAVMLRPGMSIERLNPLATSLGLKVIAGSANDVLTLRGNFTRAHFVHLAKKLLASTSIVGTAGLAIATSGSPAILNDELVVCVRRDDPLLVGKLLATINAAVVMENPFVRGQYLV